MYQQTAPVEEIISAHHEVCGMSAPSKRMMIELAIAIDVEFDAFTSLQACD